MSTFIPLAVVLAGFVTQVGQAQPTFRFDITHTIGVDAPTAKKAFEDRTNLFNKCYADAHHHPIHGWISMTITVKQDGTITTGRVDDQAIGTNNDDFPECIHDKVLPKLAFPQLDH